MTDQETRKGRGGKLSRTETVTVRLDPKLRYLAEIAARKQRRTLSSYIEWATEDSLKSVVIHQTSGDEGDATLSVADAGRYLWDIDEVERFFKLAIRYPDLLTHDEQEVWKLLKECQVLRPAQSRRYGHEMWDPIAIVDQVLPAIRRYWPSLMAAYANSKLDAPHATAEWVEQTRAKLIEERKPLKSRDTQSLRLSPDAQSPSMKSPSKTGFDDGSLN